MDKFTKDALKLEKSIHAMLPLKAKPIEEERLRDLNLANNFSQNETKSFDGVVYYPRTREIYCSLYNVADKYAILVPIDCLIFENKKAQKMVNEFIRKHPNRG